MVYVAVLMALLPNQSIDALETSGLAAAHARDLDKVRSVAKQLEEQYPDSFSATMARGSLLLRAGLSKEALEAFDVAAKMQPRQVPYMWQRGIAQYYAGEFDAGRKQFVLHREVNSNDVENAVFHFMCVAKLKDFETARKEYLPAPGDSRPPMQQVYDLFGGTASIEDVTKVMASFPKGSSAASTAGLYGELYLGIYEDLRGNRDEAIAWLEKAVARGKTYYMADIARVHLEHLKRQTKGPKK